MQGRENRHETALRVRRRLRLRLGRKGRRQRQRMDELSAAVAGCGRRCSSRCWRWRRSIVVVAVAGQHVLVAEPAALGALRAAALVLGPIQFGEKVLQQEQLSGIVAVVAVAAAPHAARRSRAVPAARLRPLRRRCGVSVATAAG